MDIRAASIACFFLSFASLMSVRAAEDPFVEGEVIVTFKEAIPTKTARAALERRALKLTQHYDRLSESSRRVSGMIRDKSRTTAQLIADLKADPEVETVEPNYLRRVFAVKPNDPEFSKLWGLENTGQVINSGNSTAGTDTRFLQAWRLSRETSAVPVVGVIDTGVEISHPDLIANIWTNPGEIAGNGIDDDANGYTDDVHGYDFAANTATMTDSSEHGTHISGTIAATGKNNLGVIGLQYKAKVIPLKVSLDGEFMEVSAVLQAYNYALALKQKGINLVALNASYGGRSYSSAEYNALNSLRTAGVVLCAAAGNQVTGESIDNDAVAEYPASYQLANIIAVAAIEQNNGLATFSHYGATSVDLAAPGVNIYSTIPRNRTNTLTIGGVTYPCQELKFSGVTTTAGLTRSVYNCGTGQLASQFPAAVNGNIALIQRGTNTFAEKATLAKNAGAVAVIIYNNVAETLAEGGWTLGQTGNWLPALQVTQASGNAIIAQLPASGTFISYVNATPTYGFQNGTSMAAPHVTAAVAFAAWNFPSETMTQRISRILTRTTAVPSLAGKTVTGGRLDLLKMIDTDNDGLPDWWETEQFGDLARTSSGDEDGDGFSNLAEFLTNTSPKSANSRLAFSTYLPATNGQDFQLSFSSVNERTYQIEWSNTLQSGSWQTLGNPIIGTGATIQINDPNARMNSPQRFYRLGILNE